MSKHTPGPWTVHNRTDVFGPHGGDSGDGAKADDNDGWQVADCAVGLTAYAGEYVELGSEVRRANARLIASAPDLLEALKQIAHRTGATSLPESVALETMRGLWYTATAAIKKAEGSEG